MITPIPAIELANLSGPLSVTLRRELMDAFPEPSSAREVTIAAGLNPHHICWNQCVRDVWGAIFDEARMRGCGKMASLYEAAVKAEAEQGLNGTCRCSDAVNAALLETA